jgi:hypothetical protein
MARTPRARRLGILLLVAALLPSLTSCGSLLYPERRGQPAGRLDAGVVALDAVGLILFVVPGVVAFVVDFADGAIYLPPSQSADAGPAPVGRELQTVRLSPAELTPQRLEAVVQEHTGRTIRLEPGAYQTRKLDNLRDVSPASLEDLGAEPVPAGVVSESVVSSKPR